MLDHLTDRSDTQMGSATNVLHNVSPDVKVTGNGTVFANDEGVDVVVPADTSDPLQIGDVDVLLPSTDEEAPADVLAEGVIAFENGQPRFSAKEDAAIARHLDEGEFDAGEIATMFHTSRASVYRASERHRQRRSADASQ